MTKEIDIKGLSKAELLAALYNASKPQGMGMLHFNPAPMTRDEAAALNPEERRFDYLLGRVMKVDLRGDTLNPWLYDRDIGNGAAQRVVDSVRAAAR